MAQCSDMEIAGLADVADVSIVYHSIWMVCEPNGSALIAPL